MVMQPYTGKDTSSTSSETEVCSGTAGRIQRSSNLHGWLSPASSRARSSWSRTPKASAYSPDLSPIEEAFSKLKAILRRVGARTPEALQEALGQALLTITDRDAHGWFTHCGYQVAHPATSLEMKS